MERLTERADGTIYCKDSYDKIIDRLAELEDKIENGTLIELPCIRKCDVGYQILYIEENNNQVTYIMYADYKKAEKKLKELKGEEK